MRGLRSGGWLIAAIGVVFTLFWLMLMAQDRAHVLDLGLLLMGPVALFGGIWLGRYPFRPRLRLQLVGDTLTVWPQTFAGEAVTLDCAELTRISLVGVGRRRWIIFDTAGTSTRMTADALSAEREEVLRRVAIRIEAQGKYLEEEMSEVMGAATGRYVVHEGAAY